MKATFITIFSFIAISVSAQVAPQKFNYQAVARNSTGSAFNYHQSSYFGKSRYCRF